MSDDRPETLPALLARTVAAHPARPAVTDAAGTLDWQGFARGVAGMAGLLAREGVGRGTRVALWLPNGREYLAAIFACARLSALAVHVNTRFRAAEVGYLLRRARAEVLVTAFDLAAADFPAILAEVPETDRTALRLVLGRGAAAPALPGLPARALRPDDAGAPAIGDGGPPFPAPDDPCLTWTTSGTTSGPKLVLHDQRSIAGHAHDAMRAIGTGRPGACFLAHTPLCGTFGNAAAMAALAGGAHIVCMERFDAEAADALIRCHRVTHQVGSDELLGRLAEAARGRRHDSLVFSGFAAFGPAAAAHVEAAERMGLAPRGVYGSSEMQALFAVQPDARRLLAGGDPVSSEAEIAIRDPGSGTALPPGQAGELCLRAPSRFRGYLDDPAATERATTADGMFRSGDLARSAGQGFVFETRLGDTLRLGGFLVAPEEIEGFLSAQPGIAGAQVVGAEADGVLVPVAFLRLAPGAMLDEAALAASCRARLARYKVPRRIVALDSFPVTESANGVKIQRARLRELARDLLRGE